MQNSELNLSPLSDALGVEIMDMSIEDAIAPHIFERVYAAFLKHHLILFNKVSLEKEGVIVRYGNRWLVSEPELYRWLRIYGKDAGRMI